MKGKRMRLGLIQEARQGQPGAARPAHDQTEVG